MAGNQDFHAPSRVDRIFNRIYGFLVGIGVGFSYNYPLQVKGRKSGKLYSTPVDLLEMEGERFLVAPRGRTQWVRNAEVAGEILLKKGRQRRRFKMRPLDGPEKVRVLKAYLDRFRREVQGYFSVPADSPAEAFEQVAENYPAFELIAL
jgi:deazaflavin-dependent oxidoreductase (nitroreductase family)